MSVRRGPAIVLSLMLSAAALAIAPTAQASDGGAAKGTVSARDEAPPKKKDCDGSSEVKLRVFLRDNLRLETISTVWSNDDDVWTWKLRHEGDLSDEGEVKAKDADKSFKIVRTMMDLAGPDAITFRAENTKTGEVCRVAGQF